MLDIFGYLPAKRKQTPSGWISFNCPICNEKRQRGGIKVIDQGWSYHCFNCGNTASFVLGRQLGYKVKTFLEKLGVSESDINALNLESLRHRSIHGILDDRARIADSISDIKFEEYDDFPPAVELITPELTQYWEYIRKRRVPEDFPTMTVIRNDGVQWVRPHVIIPFSYDNKIVGWCARFLDDRSPRYINHTQPGYVFGTELQHNDWQCVIVVEGIFDALSINGLALMHNTVSDAQARLIRNLGKDIIVVPDQDKAGLELIDRAVELGWSVSIPDWGNNVKDVNDAVIKFGKLATLLTIMQSRETSKIKIELAKRNLIKKISSA